MSEFRTRTEYLAAQLGTIDDEYNLTEYGLLNHGRGAHIVEPKEDADKVVPAIRDEIRHAGGKARVYEDGGLILTNTWERDDEIVMRVELNPAYEEIFSVIDRLEALPYFEEPDIFLREPPEKGLTSFELVINYTPANDDDVEPTINGVLNQEVWSLLDEYEVNRMNIYEEAIEITCHPRQDQFRPS